MGKRNPYAGSLSKPQYRQRVVNNKKTKHVPEVEDYDDDIQLGDNVTYQGKEGIVKNPNGPNDTIGISVDGEYKLVNPKELKIIEEALLELWKLSK